MLNDHAFEFVIIRLEGGDKITTDPADPGGLTKWGISQHAYPKLDIRKLTEEAAFEIYQDDYWDGMKCDLFKPAIALVLFDAAVNQGVTPAIKMAQATANTMTDGLMGPKTVAAINSMTELSFIRRFAKARVARYLALNNATEELYEKGWINRIIDITTEALGGQHE